MRSTYVILKRLDDLGHEAVIGQYQTEGRAETTAASYNRRAQTLGLAVSYRVIRQIRRPACFRRRVLA